MSKKQTTLTQEQLDYIDGWRGLTQPFADEFDMRIVDFDPAVTYMPPPNVIVTGRRTVELPLWFVTMIMKRVDEIKQGVIT